MTSGVTIGVEEEFHLVDPADRSLADAAERVLALAERIFCPDDPDSDYPAHFPGEVRITLRDGRQLRRREATSRGTPERRLSAAEIEHKFHANATRAVSVVQAQRIAALVWDLERLDHIDALVSACVVENGANT